MERPTDAPPGTRDETMVAVPTFPESASRVGNLEKEDFLEIPCGRLRERLYL